MDFPQVAGLNNLLASGFNPDEYEVVQYMMINEDGQLQILQEPPDLEQCEVVVLEQVSEGLKAPEGVAIPSFDPRQYALGVQIQTIDIDEVENLQSQEDIVYVNARQYHRILKRRKERERLILQGRIPKTRSKYLHESRHKHALRRVRGFGGKFVERDSGTLADDEAEDEDEEQEEIQLIGEHGGRRNPKTELDDSGMDMYDDDESFSSDILLPKFEHRDLKQEKDFKREE